MLLCVGCILLCWKKTKLEKLNFLQAVSIPNGMFISFIAEEMRGYNFLRFFSEWDVLY